MNNDIASLRKQNQELNEQVSSYKAKEVKNEFEEINGKHVLTKVVSNMDKDMFSSLFDSLKVMFDSSIIVLVNVSNDRSSLIVGVSKDLTSSYQAGKLVKEITSITGGSGGGRPEVAQGGIKDASKIDEAFASLKKGF